MLSFDLAPFVRRTRFIWLHTAASAVLFLGLIAGSAGPARAQSAPGVADPTHIADDGWGRARRHGAGAGAETDGSIPRPNRHRERGIFPNHRPINRA